MTTQLALIRNRKIICSTPVSLPGSEGSGEEGGGNMPELAAIFGIAANERRLRIMSELLKRSETRFTDLLPIAVNPKLVHDCIQPMIEKGLVTHESRGSAYVLSMKGVVLVTTLTRGMSELVRAAEEGKF